MRPAPFFFALAGVVLNITNAYEAILNADLRALITESAGISIQEFFRSKVPSRAISKTPKLYLLALISFGKYVVFVLLGCLSDGPGATIELSLIFLSRSCAP